MKLYSVPHSPYGARVSAQIRLKNLSIEVLPPPEPLRSEGFHQRFPLGKVPVLELADGTCLGESWAILEYLEECSDGALSLCPPDPLARARMREFGRYADLHLSPNALFPLFRSVLAGEPVNDATLAALHGELAKGERLTRQRGALSARPLDLGDIALAPSMLYLYLLVEGRTDGDILADYPALAEWWREVNAFAGIRETLDGVRNAFLAFTGARATA